MFQIEDINKEVAKKLKVDVKLVAKVNEIYYKEVIKAVNNYEAVDIKLVFLGTFKARYKPVKRKIRSLINTIKLLRDRKEEASDNKAKDYTKDLHNIWKLKDWFAVYNYNKAKKNLK